MALKGYIIRESRRFLAAVGDQGLELDDLVQEGFMGALEAAKRFEPTGGAGFLRYAGYWIQRNLHAAINRGLVSMPEKARLAALELGELPRSFSLDAPARLEGDMPLHEVIEGEDPAAPRLAQALARSAVLPALAHLKPRQAYVLRRRYGLDGRPEASLEDLGRELGISRERVRQVQRDAEARLRSHLTGALARLARRAS
jgi:RNA polymerase primary sigma factor